ncbi:hypothetical protein ACLB2K_077325 [Fragaria x ananassa]
MMSCKKLWSDRFSDLPDEVAHHILSFLFVKDLACVGGNYQKLGERMCFLDRYMFQRGDNKMQRFYISWIFHTLGIANKDCEELYRITSWIHNAVRCNVEELNLSFSSAYAGFTFGLPSCLYQSKSFKSLVLVCLNEMTLEAPPLSLSCNLRYLHLNSVTIVDDQRLCKWISYSCKCIKKLQLIKVKGLKHIVILSSSLESFEFYGTDLITLYISGEKLASISINWNFNSVPGNCSLKISAPNLRKLTWVGKVLNTLDLGKFLNLQTAQIFLEPTVYHNLSAIFSSICRTKVLGLNENTMKAMFKGCSMQTPLPILVLTVYLTSFSNDTVPIAASLLRRTGLLLSLTISCNSPIGDPKTISQSSSGFDKEYWESQNLAFVNHLTVLSIDLSSGSNEIEFAKYILENAPNLKKIVIRYRLGFQQSDTLQRKMIRCKNIASRVMVMIHEIR